jgi:hypothetical protein
MNRQTIPKVALLAVAAAVLTFAWQTEARWSTTITIKENNIRTGQVALAVNPTEAWLAFDGLVPNQQIDRQIAITNTGTTPLKVYLSAKKSAGYTTVFNTLRCSIRDENNQVIFDGTFAELTAREMGPELMPSSTKQYTISAHIPEDAPDDIADSYVNITFELVGEQI